MPTNKIPINPIIQSKLPKWDRVEALLEQDEDRIKANFCIKLPNEQQKTYEKRKEDYPKTFINITQDLVSSPVNAIFGQGIKEDYGRENGMLYKFSENCTLTNDRIPFARFLRDFVGVSLRAYGNVFTVIDKPRYAATSKQDERENGMPYLCNIRPQDVLNWQMVDGKLYWFAYKRQYSPNWLNPLYDDPPDTKTVECIWTVNDFFVREKNGAIINDLSYSHNFGFIPVIIQGSFLTKANDLLGNAAMDQTSNMIITFNNLLNVGVHELYKHGGSLLLLPEDSITGTNMDINATGDSKLKKQDGDGVLTYTGDRAPEYLVKDLQVDKFMEWAKFYCDCAIENEKDLKSVIKKGTGNTVVEQSGISKIVDREPIEYNLISLAEDIEQYADKVFFYFSQLSGETSEPIFEFDKDFDMRSFEQKMNEIKLASSNGMQKMTETGYKELWINTVGDITRDLKTQEVITKEMEASTIDDTDELINGMIEQQKGKFEEK